MGDRGGWRLCPPELREDDEALVAAVVSLHRDLYERYFSREPLANHKLPIQVRAFRRTGDWRIFLLLCPWMLSRCFWPDADPGIPLPAGWEGDARGDAHYTVLGPIVAFPLLETAQKAHLNFDSRLGHYLLQPLVLSMAPFENAEAVFESWNRVIETRRANMARTQRRSRWQEEVSRREFFRRFGPGENG
jgi:hypothetical protein